MCGIVGVISKAPVNQLIYDALLLLQHRGQDAAGIVTMQGTKCFMHKARGTVRDVFRTRNIRAGLPVWLTEFGYDTAPVWRDLGLGADVGLELGAGGEVLLGAEPGAGEQAAGVGRHRGVVVNRRCQFFLDIDDQQ